MPCVRQERYEQFKTFLATYPPAGVVIVMEAHGPKFFFCTDPHATVVQIIEAFGDRASIEQYFHDVKEVWGAGQQQVRLDKHRLLQPELVVANAGRMLGLEQECREIRDRESSPWDDPIDAHLTPIGAQRCDAKRYEINFQHLHPRTASHRKYEQSTIYDSGSQCKLSQISESTDQTLDGRKVLEWFSLLCLRMAYFNRELRQRVKTFQTLRTFKAALSDYTNRNWKVRMPPVRRNCTTKPFIGCWQNLFHQCFRAARSSPGKFLK